MFGKKAQAAMEFLMTYGWAILIVLAVIATLTSFGVLNTDIFVPARCIIGSVGNVNCVSYKVDTKGGLYFNLENGGGSGDMIIKKVILKNGDLGTDQCGGDVADTITGSEKGLTFSSHTKVPFYVGSTSVSKTAVTAGVCTAFANKPEGKKVKAEIKMTYVTLSDKGVEHTFSGELVAPVEPAAESCSGDVVGACSTFTTQATCPITRGCSWGGSPVSCSGTVKQCSGYSDSTACAAAAGCSWA